MKIVYLLNCCFAVVTNRFIPCKKELNGYVVKSLIPLIFFLFCLISCSKADKANDVRKLNATGLGYIQLRPNQYFIYKDSATGRQDSVIVTESSLTTESYTENNSNGSYSGTREVFSLTLTRKGAGGDSIWLKGQARGEAYLNRTMLEDISGTLIFLYPALCLCTDIYELSFFSVEGKTYSNVVVLEDAISFGYFKTFYWAPSVGVIKMIVRTANGVGGINTIWSYSLVRNN